jgi:multidrug efflux pump subunit AcrA (membrane-fusion protein)
MKAIAEIPEIHLPNIKKDSAVEVSIPVLGTQIKEKISAVGNFINPNNRSFRIEISLNNKKGALKPNMSVEIKINDYSNSEAIMVPVKDILENQKGESYVYKLQVEDQVQNTFKAIKTFVKLGKSSNNMVEILEGLEAGDRIIEDGIRLIKDQQLVKNI